MHLLADASQRREMLALYREWQCYHIRTMALWANALCCFLSLVVTPFELFLYPEYALVVGASRFVVASLGAFFFVYLKWFAGPRTRGGNLERVFLVAPPLLLTAQFIFFAFHHKGEYYAEFLFGSFVTIILSCFVMYRFWQEQYLYHAISVGLWLAVTWIEPQMMRTATLVLFMHLSAFAAFFYLRRVFVGQLYEKFHYTSSFIPKRVAKALTTWGEGDLETIFRPQRAFAVCLCMDWRNYQAMATRLEPETVSEMFASYYEAIMERLENLVPDGDYYVNWNADELFVIFYDAGGDSAATMDKALRVTKSFASEVPVAIAGLFPEKVVFDIGLATGTGALGLHGPKRMKKTTITGKAPGLAKRFEEEAKLLREQAKAGEEPTPFVVMDETLFYYATLHGLMPEEEFHSVTGTVKNIDSISCHLWRRSHRAGNARTLSPAENAG